MAAAAAICATAMSPGRRNGATASCGPRRPTRRKLIVAALGLGAVLPVRTPARAEEGPAKMSQLAAAYQDTPKGMFNCAVCTFFIRPRGCKVVSGDISLVDVPDEKQLYDYTQSVMRNTGLLGREKKNIFPGGRSPFKHAIYIIRENRTYDQVFGDLAKSGDGSALPSNPRSRKVVNGHPPSRRSRAGPSNAFTPRRI